MKNSCTIIGSSSSNLGALLMLEETLVRFEKVFEKFYILVPFKKDEYIIKKLGTSLGINIEIIEWYPKNILFSYILSNFYFLKKISKINKAFLDSKFTLDISGIAFVQKRGVKYLIYNLICILLPKNLKSQIIKLPQSFGPANSELYKKIMSIALKKCLMIFSRGESSYCMLKDIGVNSTLSLDLGLLNFENKEITSNNKLSVGIVPSVIIQKKYRQYNQEYISEIYKLIENNKSINFIIFNHTYSKKSNNFSDNLLIDEINKLVNSTNKNVEFKNNIQNLNELYQVYEQLDMVITSRYHSLVLAIKNGIYPLVIGWNNKYNDLANIFGLNESIINTDFQNSKNDFKKLNELLQKSYKLKGNTDYERVIEMNKIVEDKLLSINY